MSGDEIKSTSLLEAIQKDRVKEVEARLALGEDVEAMFSMNRTGLHCATANSNVKMVEILLKANADISKCDSNGNTSLHMACSRSGPDSLMTVKMLLESGQALPLEARNNFNRSALEESILIGNVEAAKVLLDAGASVPTSSITLAVQQNYEEMVKLIKAANNNNASGPVMQSPAVTLSAKEEREALLKRLGELDAQETGDLESQLGVLKKDFEKMKSHYAKEKKETKAEIDKLENQLHELRSKMTALIKEEDKETRKMRLEMSTLSNDIDKRKLETKPNMDLAGLLECPICTDIIKPPLQIWQCPEGHTICETCSNRPELEVCPQCRMNIQGRMSRCRVLEELSRRSFPSENIETPNDTNQQSPNDREQEAPRNQPQASRPFRASLGYIFRQRTPDDFNFEDLTSDFYRINDDEETVVVEEDIDDWTDEENDFTSTLREAFGYNDATSSFFPRYPQGQAWDRLQRTPSRGQPRRRSPGSLRVGHSSSTLTSSRGGVGHDEGMERLYARDGRPSYSRGAPDRSGRRSSSGRVRGQWGRPQDLRYFR